MNQIDMIDKIHSEQIAEEFAKILEPVFNTLIKKKYIDNMNTDLAKQLIQDIVIHTVNNINVENKQVKVNKEMFENKKVKDIEPGLSVFIENRKKEKMKQLLRHIDIKYNK